jgi:hypothetical protein
MAAGSVDRRIDPLNSLLRGEISAVATYEQAIEKVDDEHTSDAAALRAIVLERGEHAQALRDQNGEGLRRHVRVQGAGGRRTRPEGL